MRILRQLLIGIALFTVSAGIAQKTVRMEDYGIQTTKDATLVVAEVLQKVKNKNATLLFPKGVYHFYADEAYGKYHSVTNHDNSYKKFAFPLIGGKNITIDGQGSEFIFHGVITPFLIEKSSNIILKNITIDWEQPFFLQAEVLESNQKNGTIRLEIDPSVSVKLVGDQISYVTNDLELSDLGSNIAFDPNTMAVAYMASNLQLNTRTAPVSAKRINTNEYLIKGKFAGEPAAAGLIYIFKGPNSQNRLAPAIHLTSSKNIKIDNVIIHHAGGMGIIGERTENIHLNKVQVALREGSNRIVSTTADATHFCNCKGQLLIENCLFENMLDDATNIHGTHVKINKIVDKYTVRAGVIHPHQTDYIFAEKGDKINFVHSETLLPIAENIVKEVRYINDKLCEYIFKNEIPANLKEDDALDNISWYPVSTFKNNIVRNNRARSILISTRNKTIIENNYFSSMMSSILFEGDLNNWFESGSVDDVLIRNNTFGDNAYGGKAGSVIWINPRMKKTDPQRPYEKNIRIEDNVFKTFDRSILRAKSVDGLIFKNNEIIQTKTYKPINGDMPTIELVDCLNATIIHNSYQGDEKAVIDIDRNSQQGLVLDKNQLGFK